MDEREPWQWPDRDADDPIPPNTTSTIRREAIQAVKALNPVEHRMAADPAFRGTVKNNAGVKTVFSLNGRMFNFVPGHDFSGGFQHRGMCRSTLSVTCKVNNPRTFDETFHVTKRDGTVSPPLCNAAMHKLVDCYEKVRWWTPGDSESVDMTSLTDETEGYIHRCSETGEDYGWFIFPLKLFEGRTVGEAIALVLQCRQFVFDEYMVSVFAWCLIFLYLFPANKVVVILNILYRPLCISSSYQLLQSGRQRESEHVPPQPALPPQQQAPHAQPQASAEALIGQLAALQMSHIQAQAETNQSQADTNSVQMQTNAEGRAFREIQVGINRQCRDETDNLNILVGDQRRDIVSNTNNVGCMQVQIQELKSQMHNRFYAVEDDHDIGKDGSKFIMQHRSNRNHCVRFSLN